MTDTPPRPPLLARIAAAVGYVTSGRAPDWFGPGTPIAPQAPPEVAGRRFDYPSSSNLQSTPRADEEISAGQLRNLAENCDIVGLAIQTRKDQLNGLSWQFQMKDGTKRGAGEDPRLALLEAFWRFPDQQHSWEEWIGAVLDDHLILDAATIYPRRNNGGAIYGFEYIDGATIKPIIDEWGRTPMAPSPAYQQIIKGLPAVNYTRDSLLYLPRNLRTHKLYGMSPVQQVTMTVNIALRRQLSQLEYYTAGTVPDAIIGMPGSYTPEMIRDYQVWFDDLLTNNTSGRRRVRFMPGDAAKSFTQTKEAVLKDGFDEWLARIVSYAFSLSPQWAVKEMNRSTAETGQAMANAEGLAPLRKWVATLVNRCVQVGWGWDDVEFAWREEEATNPAEQATISTTYLKLGVLTINEVRMNLGLDPVEGGDVPMIYTATGAVPLSVAIAPPPPPAPPQIGHNGGPALDDATDAADAQEQLLKAASPQDRLIQAWSHFLAHEAPGVAAAITAALATSLAKAAGDDDNTADDAINAAIRATARGTVAAEDAAIAASREVQAAVEAAVEDAVAAMPWPAVEMTTADILTTETLVGIQDGFQAISAVAGVTVKDAARLANPRAVQAAADQAAALVKGVLDTTKTALNRLVTQAQAEGWTPKMLAERIVADHQFSEARAMIIARTEIKRAAVTGTIESFRATNKATGSRIGKRTILGPNENHCVVCLTAANEGVIGLDEEFSVGDAPPFHPSCWCSILPALMPKAAAT
jgi:hypothetical protein